MAVQIAPIAKPINANFDPFTSNLEIRTERIILIVKAPINEPKEEQIEVPMEISL